MEESGMVEFIEMKNMLLLAEDGIFPITKDKNGSPLPSLPASGFDIPGTIQGEGKLNGLPSLFIRLAGCNLHCCWQTSTEGISPCDTAYAAYAIKNTRTCTPEDVHAVIRQNAGNIDHLVITGGEPFLQANELITLCRLLKEDRFHLTIETNATLFDRTLAGYIDLFSLSPKLSSSVPADTHKDTHDKRRVNLQVIQDFINHANENAKDFQLKFVCACDEDIHEIQSILSQLTGWKKEDVLLMPLGGNAKDLRLSTQKTLEHCIRNGWRYCDRLHISLFDAKQGV